LVPVTLRRRRAARFALALAVVGLIAALPSIAGARPQPADRAVSAQTLLTRVRASSATGYSGYAQTAGSASIPDVADLGDIPSLLGDVTMLRVWWSGPQQWRVDTVSATNEDDTYAHPGGTWEWSSAGRTAVDVATQQVRLFRASDLTPDQLGRTLAALAAAPGVTATRDGAKRVAGRTALGVELTAAAGRAPTTVQDVQLWVDAASGVPLEVTITPVGQSRPLLTSSFLTFSDHRPKDVTDTFTPPADATVQHVAQDSPGGVLTRLRPLPVLSSVAGLQQSYEAQEFSFGDGTAAGALGYGRGLARVAAIGLSGGDARSIEKALGSAATVTTLAGARTYRISTPLVDLALLDVGGLHVVVAGTVPQSTLTTVLITLQQRRLQLFGHGPPAGVAQAAAA
jgi:hypothetical protein